MNQELKPMEVKLWLFDITDPECEKFIFNYQGKVPTIDVNVSTRSNNHLKMKIFSYAMRRIILSNILQKPTYELSFYNNSNGKPSIYNHSIAFNISHSGQYWCMAVSQHDEVGVDIEVIKTRKYQDEIVRSYFLDTEQQVYFNAKKQEEKDAIFFMCWTEKEALAKLDGISINDVLAKNNVSQKGLYLHQRQLFNSDLALCLASKKEVGAIYSINEAKLCN